MDNNDFNDKDYNANVNQASTDHKSQDQKQKEKDALTLSINALNVSSQEFIKGFKEADQRTHETMNELKVLMKQYEEHTDAISKQTRVLSLLPEKIHDRVENLPPQIAFEVEKLYISKQEELEKHFTSLQNRLNEEVESYKQLLAEASSQCINTLSSATEQFKNTVETRLEKYVSDLVTNVQNVLETRRFIFLRNFAIILGFSITVSLVGTYYVTNKLPRFFTINETRDVAIKDSEVRIFNPKSTTDNKQGAETKGSTETKK